MEKRKIAVGLGTVILSMISFAMALCSLTSPHWGTYTQKGSSEPEGHFGPWKVCTYQSRKSNCKEHTNFEPSGSTLGAGVVAILSIVFLSITMFISWLPMTMLVYREPFCLSFKKSIWTKLVCAVVATILSFISAVLFSREESDSLEHTIGRAWAFYLQLAIIFSEAGVSLLSWLELRWSRQLGGDPTLYSRDQDGKHTEAIQNPGFRDENGLKSSAKNHHHHSNSKSSHHHHDGAVTERVTSPNGHSHHSHHKHNHLIITIKITIITIINLSLMVHWTPQLTPTRCVHLR